MNPVEPAEEMIESQFCKALAGYVKIHLPRYMSDEEVGLIWIVLNKKQIFIVLRNSSPDQPDWYSKDGCVYLNSSDAHDEWENHLRSYLNYSIEGALASTNESIRALAMFDKRVDKRRLYSLVDEIESAPLLVKHFYTIRCEAEGIEVSAQ